MAGKRLSDNNAVTSESPLLSTDSLVVANPGEDRILSFAELTRILHVGVEGVESVRFASESDLAAVTNPENAKYRFHNGQIQFFNTDDSQWYTVSITVSGGKKLSWGDYSAVAVNNQGVIQYPANFIAANNIISVDGGSLKALTPGSGIIGSSYNGTTPRTWSIDQELIRSIVSSIIGEVAADNLVFVAPTGEHIKITAEVINGVAVLNPQIIENDE